MLDFLEINFSKAKAVCFNNAGLYLYAYKQETIGALETVISSLLHILNFLLISLLHSVEQSSSLSAFPSTRAFIHDRFQRDISHVLGSSILLILSGVVSHPFEMAMKLVCLSCLFFGRFLLMTPNCISALFKRGGLGKYFESSIL